jgi:hypothetical protein
MCGGRLTPGEKTVEKRERLPLLRFNGRFYSADRCKLLLLSSLEAVPSRPVLCVSPILAH